MEMCAENQRLFEEEKPDSCFVWTTAATHTPTHIPNARTLYTLSSISFKIRDIVLWPAKTQWKMNRIGKHGWLQGAECRPSRFSPSLFADLADFTDRMQKRCRARGALRWGQFVQDQAKSSQTAPVILKSNMEELCSACRWRWESKKRASLYYVFTYEFRDASLKLASTTGYNITTSQSFSWIPGESNEKARNHIRDLGQPWKMTTMLKLSALTKADMGAIQDSEKL